MNCVEAREYMLDAEPEDLRQAVAIHLQSCAECSRIAHSIIAEMDELKSAVDDLTSYAGSVVSISAAPSVTARADHARRRFPSYLAAAAVVACVALGASAIQRELARKAGERYPLYLPVVPALTAPKVNARGSGAVAVIRTNNPKITVIWYLAPRGKS